MKKQINVGVVGFGNLGQSVVEQLENHELFNLIAVFSKRNLENTQPLETIVDYENKIDLLFLCGGSKNDLEIQSKKLIKYFNTIDCYDNHERLAEHIRNIDALAKEHNKIALCALGWDPGLFSLIRGLFSGLNLTPHTFWGKGTSQGHTQAIKQIKGVIDAIQFTIPNEETIAKVKNGEQFNKFDMHKRECYVVCKKEDEEFITKEIINMPHYFEGYETIVNFVSQEELNNVKTFTHKGMVITEKDIINFSLNLPSNPDFTASVMVNFAKSYIKLKQNKQFGAFTIFDIPIKNILKDIEIDLLL